MVLTLCVGERPIQIISTPGVLGAVVLPVFRREVDLAAACVDKSRAELVGHSEPIAQPFEEVSTERSTFSANKLRRFYC